MSESPSFVACWREGGDLRLLSPAGEAQCHPLPLAPAASIEVLAESMATVFAAQAERTPVGQRWLLLLEPTLPVKWQHWPWEQMTWRGKPLGASALIVRQARLGAAPPVGDKLLVDLFPRREFDFSVALQPELASGALRKAVPRFLGTEIAGCSELFLVAHGNAGGLLDASGRPVEFPNVRPLPDTIWLLACEADAAMASLADRMLERGARRVITPRRQLAAEKMAGLIKARLAATEPDAAIWLAGYDYAADGGSAELTVWGTAALDPTPGRWNASVWDHLHGTATLPLGHLTSAGKFDAAFTAAAAPDAWPLTRQTMAAPLLLLAERFDYERMTLLQSWVGDNDSPAAMRALAAAARRIGQYPATARDLSFSLARADLGTKEKADCLGALANLLIDLDLPAAAIRCIDAHDDCIASAPRDFAFAAFKQLDWKSRATARDGKLQTSLDHLTRKRRQASKVEGGGDGTRELAGLLYGTVWLASTGAACLPKATLLANEVRTCLPEPNEEAIGAGNYDTRYLLRAFAAHAWQSADAAALAVLGVWHPIAERQLVTDADPGPWAYVLCYLHLAGYAGTIELDRALGALKHAHYFLEAAAFAALAGRPDEAQTYLNRFQERRQQTIAQLVWGDVDLLHSEAEHRSGLESSTIAAASAASFAANGVMPL